MPTVKKHKRRIKKFPIKVYVNIRIGYPGHTHMSVIVPIYLDEKESKNELSDEQYKKDYRLYKNYWSHYRYGVTFLRKPNGDLEWFDRKIG